MVVMAAFYKDPVGILYELYTKAHQIKPFGETKVEEGLVSISQLACSEITVLLSLGSPGDVQKNSQAVQQPWQLKTAPH